MSTRKTTITLPEILWKRLKVEAIESDKTLSQLITEKLEKDRNS